VAARPPLLLERRRPPGYITPIVGEMLVTIARGLRRHERFPLRTLRLPPLTDSRLSVLERNGRSIARSCTTRRRRAVSDVEQHHPRARTGRGPIPAAASGHPDACHFAGLGIQTYGFLLLRLLKVLPRGLIHRHDEYVPLAFRPSSSAHRLSYGDCRTKSQSLKCFVRADLCTAPPAGAVAVLERRRSAASVRPSWSRSVTTLDESRELRADRADRA
jgi:hypothetical protein